MKLDRTLKRIEIEKEYEYDKWDKLIPFIDFPKKWKIKMRPPFGGAIVRFAVKESSSKVDDYVSIYLDCYDELGLFGEPYWEIYPVDGDVARCKMNEIASLLKYIKQGLKELKKKVKQR